MANAEYATYDIKEPSLRISWNPVAGAAAEEAKRNGQKVYSGGGHIRIPQCLVEAFEKAHKKLITDGRLVRRGQSLPRVTVGTKPMEMPAKVQEPKQSLQPAVEVPASEESIAPLTAYKGLGK